MEGQRKIEDIVPDAGQPVKAVDSERIKVTVHIPENMSETSRQQKINRIYDILNPDTPR